MLVKHDVNVTDLTMLHNALYPVLGFLMMFCFEHKLPCTITSVYRANDPGPHGSVPVRAIDFSVKGWTNHDMAKFKQDVTNKYGYLGAKSKSDNKQRLIIFHGPVKHGHLQVLP